MSVQHELVPDGDYRPRLLYLINAAEYFFSHRLSLARRARDAGYDVAVACRATDSEARRIDAEGFSFLPLDWRRESLSPIHLIQVVREVSKAYRAWRPDVIHHVALVPVVLGTMASRSAPQAGIVNALTGLGFVFTNSSPKARVIRSVLRPVLRALLARSQTVTTVENDDDARYLRAHHLVDSGRLTVVRGSGVDVDAFNVLPIPEEDPPVVALVGRMLKMKGIETAVEAFERLAAKGVLARLLLVGNPDPANPTAISESWLRALNERPNVEWLGHIDDVRGVWMRAALCLQPSLGGEGVPRSLLEAAACQRGAIVSDVPGCRDVVRHGTNGLLVPSGDAGALAGAIEQALSDRTVLKSWGQASRVLVTRGGFDDASVCATMLELYRRVAPGAGLSLRASQPGGAH